MQRTRRFIQCDVFSPTPTLGNALAVVLDGKGLSDSEMQTFAAWTNLAETTFLMPPTDPEADYQVRIFTTAHEMLFAGHPTLGSCASWLHSGGKPKNPNVVRQQCGVGIVEIDQRGNTPAFIAPPTDIQALPQTDIDTMASALKLTPDSITDTARLDNGPVWQVFELASAQDVLEVDSTLANWSERKMVGLIGPHDSGNECDYEVRMFAPAAGMVEDPITGSLNSALAHWMLGNGKLDRDLLIAQGTCINRHGRVSVRPNPEQPGQVYIGGETHIMIEGSVTL